LSRRLARAKTLAANQDGQTQKNQCQTTGPEKLGSWGWQTASLHNESIPETTGT
jgi:hypothetical protein